MQNELAVIGEEKPSAVQNTESFSSGIRRMLLQRAADDVPAEGAGRELPGYESIYELARDAGVTLEDYVRRDPKGAVRRAEAGLASWQNILTQAAMTGSLELTDESGTPTALAVTKNQTKLLEMRVSEARKQLEDIKELVLSSYSDDDLRKDALEKSMYRRALRGDSRLAIYLHDRVDGRPSESKQTEVCYDNAYNIYAIIHTLFKEQLDVFHSGNGTVLICCSRRAGKSHLLVSTCLTEALLKPKTKCMYIGETMELTENIVRSEMDKIIDECNLRDKHGKRLDWKHLDNGSEILIRGLSNTKDPDQIRGQGVKIIVIDEFFHLRSELLEYMQREVLTPMQMDYADSYKFICAGTPPRVKGTYGEKAWREWDVPHFKWTWEQNPHPVDVKLRKAFIEKELREKGVDWDSSFARREYLGEWAYDDDLLLYPEYHCYDKREAVPTIQASRILFGIDYGVSDNDCIWGCVWNDDEQRGYQFWEDKFNRLDIMGRGISQLEYLGEQIKAAWRMAMDYFPGLEPKEANKRILWDADDNDQHLTDYLNVNVRLDGLEGIRLNIANAHKTDKSIMYDRIRDVLRKGDLLIIKGGKCEQELESTILKRGPNGEVYKEVDSKAYHPDLLPAMRYALWNCVGVQ